MTDKKEQRDKLEAESAEIDRKYLTGWGYKKDLSDPS